MISSLLTKWRGKPHSDRPPCGRHIATTPPAGKATFRVQFRGGCPFGFWSAAVSAALGFSFLHSERRKKPKRRGPPHSKARTPKAKDATFKLNSGEQALAPHR